MPPKSTPTAKKSGAAAEKARARRAQPAAPAKPKKASKKAPAKLKRSASSSPRSKPMAARHAEKKATLARSSAAQRALEKVREICKTWPETSEVQAWGHPTFRVRNKMFAGFGGDGAETSFSFKTTLEHQAGLVDAEPERFSIAAYVGKHGWVTMKLNARVDWGEVTALLRGSYLLIAPAKLAALA